mgnify:CR=1 FL=1
MIAIETKQLTKHYDAIIAVDNFTLSIPSGEFFALLGENGAGKTTAVKMLCCLTPPTSGEAWLLGDSILTSPNAVKQKTDISPQETAIAPALSVRENLELMARIYRIPPEKVTIKVDALLEDLGLAEQAQQRAKTLSGGMQRRLSIAMALISDPEILFLDEPTLGLDVRARRKLWKTLLALKGRTTVVLTTHYMEEAEALADRIGVISRGKLQAAGNVAHLKSVTQTDSLEDAFLKLTDMEML